MKVVYTSDLHGDIRLYEELLELARSSSVQIIALGGDLLPSFPPTKRYEDMIPYQEKFIAQFLLPFFKKLTESTAVNKILTIPGNWDLGYPFLFEKPSDEIVDLNQKVFRLKNEYEVIGYPFVPPSPFRPKEYEKMDDPDSPWPPQKYPCYIRATGPLDRIAPVDPAVYLKQRGTIQEDLSHPIKPLLFKRTIYVMHSPPFGTHLDLIQGGKPAGSRSIKTFIERNQPFLTLHGHIHEAPEISGAYTERIGETLSVNPGQSAWAGPAISRLNAVIFEIENPEETIIHTRYSRGRK